MGSWLTYGLGSESEDLPGFVVLLSGEASARRRQILLGQRLSAHGLPGRAVPLAGRPGAVPLQSRRAWPRETRRGSLDLIGDLNRAHLADDGRSGDRHAHRLVRDGLPHADQRAGADRPIARSRREILEMYGTEPGKPSLRQQLPAGPAAGRARRALRAALPPRLGHTRRPATTRTSSTSWHGSAARPTRPRPRWSRI